MRRILLILVRILRWIFAIDRPMRYESREQFMQRKIFWEVTVPNQPVDLVRQAHMGESFNTAFNIPVSANERQLLMYPLTQELVEIIRTTSRFACQKKEFSYRLTDCKFTDNELSGTVLATIQFQDDAKGINLDYRDVPIRIKLGGKPGKGWHIDSIEYL